MKKMNLFLAIAGMCAATQVMAQVDVTPANWKFDGMQIGSADRIFVREAAAYGGNFKSQTLPDGRKGYRWGDELPGSFFVAHWTGGAEPGYADMTPEEKEEFETFYKSFKIVDGGALGKIMMYKGNSSTCSDPRAEKNPIAMGAPNIFVASQRDLPTGIYKLTIPIRIFLNDEVTASINNYVGTSWWDGLPLAGSGGSDYANFQFESITDFNDFWTSYEFEVEVKSNSDPKYDFCPILFKMGLGGLSNTATVFFNDFKLEKMDRITLDGKLKIDPVDWNDTPTNIAETTADENVIVYANDKGIQVLDAQSAIEVYASNGQLIVKAEPTSTATLIPISQKGAYIVKIGNISKKVIF